MSSYLTTRRQRFTDFVLIYSLLTCAKARSYRGTIKVTAQTLCSLSVSIDHSNIYKCHCFLPLHTKQSHLPRFYTCSNLLSSLHIFASDQHVQLTVNCTFLFVCALNCKLNKAIVITAEHQERASISSQITCPAIAHSPD